MVRLVRALAVWLELVTRKDGAAYRRARDADFLIYIASFLSIKKI
jgi:hypothetical protein